SPPTARTARTWLRRRARRFVPRGRPSPLPPPPPGPENWSFSAAAGCDRWSGVRDEVCDGVTDRVVRGGAREEIPAVLRALHEDGALGGRGHALQQLRDLGLVDQGIVLAADHEDRCRDRR